MLSTYIYAKNGSVEIKEFQPRQRCIFGGNKKVSLDFLRTKDGNSIIDCIDTKSLENIKHSDDSYSVVYRSENMEPIIAQLVHNKNKDKNTNEGLVLFSIDLEGLFYDFSSKNVNVIKAAQDANNLTMAVRYVHPKSIKECDEDTYSFTLHLYNPKGKDGVFIKQKFCINPFFGLVMKRVEVEAPNDATIEYVKTTKRYFKIKRHIPIRPCNNIIVPKMVDIENTINRIHNKYHINKKYINCVAMDDENYDSIINKWKTVKHIQAVSVAIPTNELSDEQRKEYKLDNLSVIFDICNIVTHNLKVSLYHPNNN